MLSPSASHQAPSEHVLVLLQVIGGQVSEQEDDNDRLAYWLANTATLLHLLQLNLQPPSCWNSSLKQRASTVTAEDRFTGGPSEPTSKHYSTL